MTNTFDIMLESYRKWADPFSRKAARAALDRAAVTPNGKIFDVAAGIGALILPAAEAGYQVRGIDLAEMMREVLDKELVRYPGSSTEVMDATELRFPDDSVDAAFSIFGVFFFDIAPESLREMTRVTRPGGAVGAAHWADPMGAPTFRLLSRAATRMGDPTVEPIGT